MSVRFDILTLFPEMIEGMLNQSILKRAIEKKIIEVNIINFRDFQPINIQQLMTMHMVVELVC